MNKLKSLKIKNLCKGNIFWESSGKTNIQAICLEDAERVEKDANHAAGWKVKVKNYNGETTYFQSDEFSYFIQLYASPNVIGHNYYHDGRVTKTIIKNKNLMEIDVKS